MRAAPDVSVETPNEGAMVASLEDSGSVNITEKSVTLSSIINFHATHKYKYYNVSTNI